MFSEYLFEKHLPAHAPGWFRRGVEEESRAMP
jgi:hypothetical protein